MAEECDILYLDREKGLRDAIRCLRENPRDTGSYPRGAKEEGPDRFEEPKVAGREVVTSTLFGL